MSNITLNETQEAVLYEILNMTGVPLMELDSDYGMDCLESIIQRRPEMDEIDVNRVSLQIFRLLGGH